MDELEARLTLSFGRAFKMMEAWIQADFNETARRAIACVFGSSPEFEMVEALARSTEPLQLSGLGVRSGGTRRELAPSGRLRQALRRMEGAGMLINVGSQSGPLYQMNLLKGESRLFKSLFENETS